MQAIFIVDGKRVPIKCQKSDVEEVLYRHTVKGARESTSCHFCIEQQGRCTICRLGKQLYRYYGGDESCPCQRILQGADLAIYNIHHGWGTEADVNIMANFRRRVVAAVKRGEKHA